MRAHNNIVFSAGEPYKRYATTVKYSVTGVRLNPHDLKERQVFILGDDDHNEGFDYEKHVIEVYSEREDKFFIQGNRYLFQTGLIAEHKDSIKDVSMENAITDEQVLEIASLRTVDALLGKLASFSSKVTIQRILHTAEEIGRPKRFIQVIKTFAESME